MTAQIQEGIKAAQTDLIKEKTKEQEEEVSSAINSVCVSNGLVSAIGYTEVCAYSWVSGRVAISHLTHC